jgi:hypothetical protein
LRWVFEAKKRFGLSVLNYMVTSNHIHLLVKGHESRKTWGFTLSHLLKRLERSVAIGRLERFEQISLAAVSDAPEMTRQKMGVGARHRLFS